MVQERDAKDTEAKGEETVANNAAEPDAFFLREVK
jgi:hypothetical protein